jgi:hypothetical protein
VRPGLPVLCSFKPKEVSTVRLGLRFGTSFLLATLIGVSGCAVQPAQDDASESSGDLESAGTVEKTAELCRCPEDEQVDHFTVALQAAVAGDLEAAAAALARHETLGGDRNRAEASAGRALTDVLSRYAVGESDVNTSAAVSQRATLIELVLAVIDGLEAELTAVSSQNTALAADLEKREEALKRLRELTLGQPEA